MAFTFIAAASAFNDAAGTTLDCSSSLNVAAGDLLVMWGKHETTDTTFAGAKNSGSPANAFTFDAADEINHGFQAFGAAFGYVLSAAADATATFRLTIGASSGFRRVLVLQFRPGAGETVTKDASNKASGTSTAVNSGNITTTGTDEVVVGGYGEFSAQVTASEQINGVAATEPTGSPVGNSSVWYRILTATFAGGAASATIGAAVEWVAGVIAFKLAPPPKPLYQATGTLANGVGDVTVAWPTHAIGDVALLGIETADEVAALGTPAGFEQLPSSPQAGTAPLGINKSRLTAFWCRATSTSMASPVVTDPGDHAIAYITTYRGCRPTGNPWNNTVGDAVAGTAEAAVAVPGGTVTQADCLIVSIVSYKQQGPNLSGWANADLTLVTQRADLGAADGNAGSIGVATGEKATAGSFAATTATLSTASQQGRIMVALAPQTSSYPPTLPADIYNYEGEA